ncbi:MAG: hypothetical protein P0S95_07400 [Rhabdochlamydiaceae bacterium]|nr:hypothetical protein [Candidatus Amphrikana amoebophyrae]
MIDPISRRGGSILKETVVQATKTTVPTSLVLSKLIHCFHAAYKGLSLVTLALGFGLHVLAIKVVNLFFKKELAYSTVSQLDKKEAEPDLDSTLWVYAPSERKDFALCRRQASLIEKNETGVLTDSKVRAAPVEFQREMVDKQCEIVRELIKEAKPGEKVDLVVGAKERLSRVEFGENKRVILFGDDAVKMSRRIRVERHINVGWEYTHYGMKYTTPDTTSGPKLEIRIVSFEFPQIDPDRKYPDIVLPDQKQEFLKSLSEDVEQSQEKGIEFSFLNLARYKKREKGLGLNYLML